MSAAQVALPRRRGRSRAGAVRRRRRLALALVAAAALSALYWFWFRDSSLVAVSTVKVEGVGAGPASQQLRSALTEAGKEMTTLHLHPELLDQAVRPFPLVQSVSADPGFPSTLTVKVTERRPASVIGSGDRAVAVSDDGTVLRGLPAAKLQLPRLPLQSPPKQPHLDGPVLQQALVLGAMPKPFRTLSDHSLNGESGVVVLLRGGVELRFGTAAHAAEKWRAAAAVLTDPGLGALDYVDLRVPTRPAVGGVGHTAPPITAP
jgi:cell division protein FtsQ